MKNWCQLVRHSFCSAVRKHRVGSAVPCATRGRFKGHWRCKDAFFFFPPELAPKHHPVPSPVNTHKHSIQKTTSTHFVCLHNADARNKRTSIPSRLKFAAARRASPREAPMPISRRHIRQRRRISRATLQRPVAFIGQHLPEQSDGAVLLSLGKRLTSSRPPPKGISAGEGPGGGRRDAPAPPAWSPRHHTNTVTVPQSRDGAAPGKTARLSALIDLT